MDGSSTSTLNNFNFEVVAVFAAVLLALFLAVAALVTVVQRRNGGTVGGGFTRSMDLVVYTVILFQTTLLVSNDASKQVLSKHAHGQNTFIADFFDSVSIFQLDFRSVHVGSTATLY